MSPEQKIEWEERKQLAHDFARGAFVWAIRNGVPAGEARHAVQKMTVLALGSGKTAE